MPPPPEADSGGTGAGRRWLIALIISAVIAAGIGLILSSDSFRSRAEAPAPPVPNEQTRQLAPAPAAVTVRSDLIEPPAPSAPDPELDARRDYVLALATGSAEAMDLFLSRHPEGFHADLARMQRKRFAERELPAVIRQLNAELKRVGCGPTGNAEWSQASQQALALFNRHAQTAFDVKAPSADALKAVKEKTARVCPALPAKAAEAPQPKRSWLFWQ